MNKLLLISLLVAVCCPAQADRAFGVKGKVQLVIHETPCLNTTIQAHIVRMGGGHLLDKFKAATLTYGGRDWQSCWVEMDGFVVSVDEEGSPLEPIELARFKEDGV